MFDVKEQRLLDQKWKIVTKKGYFNLEVNEIKEKIVDVREAIEKNCCKGSVGFAKKDNVVCEN